MDSNTFINTYIELAVNNLLEQMKTNLQLQTQVKVSEIVVAEKDQIIASLQGQLQEKQENSAQEWITKSEDYRVKYESAEANYSAVMGQLGHLNTAINQIAEMKQIIIAKDTEIANITQLVNTFKAEKNVFLIEKTTLNNQIVELQTKTEKKNEPTSVVQDKPLPIKAINTKVKNKNSDKLTDDF